MKLFLEVCANLLMKIPCLTNIGKFKLFHMNVPLIIYGIDLLSNKPYFQDLKALKHEMSINTSKPNIN